MLVQWIERQQDARHRAETALPQRPPSDVDARDARNREEDERQPREALQRLKDSREA